MPPPVASHTRTRAHSRTSAGRTDARRDRAVAQRERRHVDRLAPEADVDRDARGEPLTVDAVVLDEAAAPGEGHVAVVVDRDRGDRFGAAVDGGTREHLPVEASQTTVAPVLVRYVTR